MFAGAARRRRPDLTSGCTSGSPFSGRFCALRVRCTISTFGAVAGGVSCCATAPKVEAGRRPSPGHRPPPHCVRTGTSPSARTVPISAPFNRPSAARHFQQAGALRQCRLGLGLRLIGLAASKIAPRSSSSWGASCRCFTAIRLCPACRMLQFDGLMRLVQQAEPAGVPVARGLGPTARGRAALHPRSSHERTPPSGTVGAAPAPRSPGRQAGRRGRSPGRGSPPAPASRPKRPPRTDRRHATVPASAPRPPRADERARPPAPVMPARCEIGYDGLRRSLCSLGWPAVCLDLTMAPTVRLVVGSTSPYNASARRRSKVDGPRSRRPARSVVAIRSRSPGRAGRAIEAVVRLSSSGGEHDQLCFPQNTRPPCVHLVGSGPRPLRLERHPVAAHRSRRRGGVPAA
jgi:hypothetical protein